MPSALTRFSFIIFLAFIAAYASQLMWGAIPSIVVAISFLSFPLAYSYVNLARLRKYAITDAVENMPLPSGYWEEVFFRLQRLVQGLK